MRVLIACEYSGTFRRAFARLGFDAWSVDLLPSEDNSPNHVVGDCFDAISAMRPDAVVAHPPCTRLCVSGARWWKDFPDEHTAGKAFFMRFTRLQMPWAIENPIGCMSTEYRKPDMICQPWQHGHGETKATCWWLHKLPTFGPSNIVSGREAKCHRASPGPERWKDRSRSYPGIAAAAAAAWGAALRKEKDQ